jgi:hypothetical protein
MPALSAATMNVASMNVASRSRINPVASGTRAGGADSLRLKKVRAHVSPRRTLSDPKNEIHSIRTTVVPATVACSESRRGRVFTRRV